MSSLSSVGLSLPKGPRVTSDMMELGALLKAWVPSEAVVDQNTLKEKNGHACYLKTQKLKFKQFQLILNEDSVSFYRKIEKTSQLKMMFQHSINEMHVRLGPSEQCNDSKQTFHSVILVLSTGMHRALFFTSKESQNKQFNELLKLQGFKEPLDQYELGSASLQRGEDFTVHLAKHKILGTIAAVKLSKKIKLD